MKKIITSLLAVCLLLSVTSLASCARSAPPPLEEVYDELVDVIEASHEVNVLLFGAGLPTYPRGNAEDTLVHRYYGVTDDGNLYVTPYAKYRHVEEMKEAIAAVYGSDYRESLYESVFTGHAIAENVDTVLPARYTQGENALFQSSRVDALVHGVRTYDYAGMKIVSPSTASRLRVSVPSCTDTDPEWKTVYLSFVLEDGRWYLDSPSC
jgi:hypothetical protein